MSSTIFLFAQDELCVMFILYIPTLKKRPSWFLHAILYLILAFSPNSRTTLNFT